MDKIRLSEEQLADAERLKELFIKKVKTTAREFGEKYEIGSPSILSHHIHGNKPLSLDALLKYARGLNVPPSAISPTLAKRLEGLIITKQDQNEEEKAVNFAQLALNELLADKEVKDAIKDYLSKKSQQNTLINNEGIKMLPLVEIKDSVLDKKGREENNLKMHALSIGCSDDAFLICVEDDSCSPIIIKGDVVIIDPEVEVKPGHFVLASVDGVPAPVLRRYKQRTIDEFELSAPSDSYPTYSSKNDYIKIIGVVHTGMSKYI